MVRAWLKEMGKKWFTGAARGRGVRRGGVQLTVEALEERAVPALGQVTLTLYPGAVTTTNAGVTTVTMKAGANLPFSVQAVRTDTYASPFTGDVYLDVKNANGTLVAKADYTLQNGSSVSQSWTAAWLTKVGQHYTVQLSQWDPSNQRIQQYAWIGSANFQQISVTPREMASISLTDANGNPFNGTVSMAVGGSTEVTVTAYDVYGNVATSANHAINLTSSNLNGLAIYDDSGNPISSIMPYYGSASFYVTAVHSTAFLQATSFTLTASATNASGQFFQSNSVQFAVSPSLYNFQFVVAHYDSGIYYFPLTINETAANLLQAENAAVARYADVWGWSGTIESGGSTGPAN